MTVIHDDKPEDEDEDEAGLSTFFILVGVTIALVLAFVGFLIKVLK
jgi:hypothetical protein